MGLCDTQFFVLIPADQLPALIKTSLNTHLYQVLHVANKLIIFSLSGSQILIMLWPMAQKENA